VTGLSIFKVQDGCDYKCTYCTVQLHEDFAFRRIENVLKCCRNFWSKTLKKLFTGVNIGDEGGNSEIKKTKKKKHEHTFLRISTNVDEGIEGRISSIEPNL
jgi:threonylcarbamoyladenosine tRNA methylthiotransferase MtaB